MRWRSPLVVISFAASLPAQTSSLRTRWAADVRPDAVHAEYPRPQLVRPRWQNLNGTWSYAIAPRDAERPARFDGDILVPFPVESQLSGVRRRVGPDQRLWYRRTFRVPALTERDAGWLLHFGAVDWEARAWVDGRAVGEHHGGYDGFAFDLGALDAGREHELLVAVHDPSDLGPQPRGKQVSKPHGIWYTPVTGIWQTVWLEPVPRTRVAGYVPVADLGARTLRLRVVLDGPTDGVTVNASVRAGGAVVASARGGNALDLRFAAAPRPWSPADPFLHDLEIEVLDGDGSLLDRVAGYVGLREIALRNDGDGVPRLFLNGAPLFQFGPLDQGWWPDGLYTAPTDAALRYDLEVTKQLGFNMVRKHVKVESARWYHHCDRLGLLVWQDMPSGDRSAPWDANGTHDGKQIERTPDSRATYDRELRAMVATLQPFACIVMWVPFNEAWGQFDTERVTKELMALDPTRLVNCASGGNDFPVGHVKDLHCYPGPAAPGRDPQRASVLGEFGGLGLPLAGHTWTDEKNWGYRSFQDRDALTRAYLDLIRDLRPLIGEGLAAAVYTQTTDVESEVNGLLTYDRAVSKLTADVVPAHRALYEPPPRTVTLLPTSEAAGAEWRYTLQQPAAGWHDATFDDGAWARGPGGFGSHGPPGAVVRTEWTSAAIWLRREFAWTGERPRALHLRLHHDEDVEVWLNGVRVGERVGYTTRYSLVPIDGAVLRAGKNVFAVHCKQTRGGQYVDVGLVDVQAR